MIAHRCFVDLFQTFRIVRKLKITDANSFCLRAFQRLGGNIDRVKLFPLPYTTRDTTRKKVRMYVPTPQQGNKNG